MVNEPAKNTSASPAKKSLFICVMKSPWTKVAFAAGVIYALIHFNRIDLHNFAGLSHTWGWLVLAFVLMLPTYVIVSYRFWRVLRNQGIDVNFTQALRWTMVGSFFDIAMPSNSGGDVVKTGYIVRYVGAGMRTKGVMAVAFDRVLGLMGLLLLASVTSIAGWSVVRVMPGSKEVIIFLAFVSFGSLFFFRVVGARRLYNNKRFRQLLERIPAGARLYNIIASFNSLREKPADFFTVLGLSMLNHVFWCASLLCITAAFGQAVGPVLGFTVFPLAIFSNVFGFAGGFGVGTAAFDLIFAKLLDVHVGAAIGLTFQMLSALSRLTGLPFYLTPGLSEKKSSHAT